MKMEPRQSKHNKVHLLIISETGKVKSRKVSVRFLKWVAGVFLVCFLLTSTFTYLYFRNLRTHRVVRDASADLTKEIDTLRGKVEEQALEIKRLQGVVERLNRENQDLKQHLISRKPPAPAVTPETKPEPSPLDKSPLSKEVEAFRRFVTQIKALKPVHPIVSFHIRDPRVEVSQNETVVSFKLYKDILKKMTGKIVLVGVYIPEDPAKAGKVVAFPRRSVVGYRIRPAYGRYFRIERQFLPFEAKLPHPEGVSRFSEFHVLVYGMKRNLLFHEEFKAP